MDGCYSCGRNAIEAEALPSREQIHLDAHWRVAHALSSALPGWLVILPRRHILSLSDMTAEEASTLGSLLPRLSRALETVTGARKCYLMFFAEAPGFEHLHIHLVPRFEDLPEDRRGPSVMYYLNRPRHEWIAEGEMDRVAEEVRERLS